MARYIDKFRDELMDKFLRLCNYNDFSKLNLEKIADTINEIYDKCVVDTPTADVVEVVRCKDCKHRQELDGYEIHLYIEGCVACTQISPARERLVMMPNDFCSYGERRTE